MNGEEFKEDLENINEKEVDHDFIQESNKESDDKDDDLSWIKDYDENSEDNELDDLSWLKDYDENSEDNKLDDLSWIKDYDEKSEDNELDDLSWLKNYDENSENKEISQKTIEKSNNMIIQDEFKNKYNLNLRNEREGIDNERKQEFIEINEKDLDQKDIDNKIITDENYEIQRIKNYIKNIEWNSITKDWTIKSRKNHYVTIQLDPKQDCSKNNPLYRHRGWLERVYNDDKLKLSNQKLAKICGVSDNTIRYWRKNLNIPTKISNRWIGKGGHVMMRMPKEYVHPQLKPIKGKIVRAEHKVVMEKYLSEHPELEWSKKHLIHGKYIKKGCVVHHINFIPNDNRLENLMLYNNNIEHKKSEGTMFDCYRDLIKLNQIGFKNGDYYLNKDFDYKVLSSSKIEEILKPNSINPYEDINLVKKEIKKIEWNKISDDWTIEHNNKTILLDPYSDCSKANPLYKHKIWVEHLVHDKRFNLTNPRLARVCEITINIMKHWRHRIHDIKTGRESMSFGRFVINGYIWTKVPKDHENPFAKKNKGYIREHRYIIKRHLVEQPELEWSKKYLIDGKYLKSECDVHHINFDTLDNRLENLWIYENTKMHGLIKGSLFSLVDELLKSKYIAFSKGKYHVIH